MRRIEALLAKVTACKTGPACLDFEFQSKE